MRIRDLFGRRAAAGLAMLVLSLAGPAGTATGQAPSYADFDALTAQLRAIAEGSGLASLESIGISHEGREIWMMTVGDAAAGPLDGRPALLVVGNLEGDHVLGSALAVEAARYLTSGADADALRDVLDNTVVYLVPRLNPDAAEAMFAAVARDRRGNARPHDDDNDGRTDEDPGEDLNGDGLITVMRVPDPYGEYVIDGDDPRLMKRADAAADDGERYALYVEGVDSDGDGFLNEDGPGGVDLNRNFQHAYPYWQADAGPHMVSEPETRALTDFVIGHRNIAAILTFGHTDNLVTPPDSQGNLGSFATLGLDAWAASADGVFEVGDLRDERPRFGFGGFFGGFFGGPGPRLRGAQLGRDNDPGSGRRPATTVNDDDIRYFKAISDVYREITGIEKVGVNRQPEGAFFQYGYYQFGVPSFSTQGWALPESPAAEAGEEQEEAGAAAGEAGQAGPPADMRQRGGAGMNQGPSGGRPGGRPGGGRGADAAVADGAILAALEGAGIEAFVDWAPHEHPDLGAVEIGGFRPYAATNPPAEQLQESGRRHGEFVARLASMLPRVRFAATEVENHGGGVFTITAEIENTGYLPTSLRHGLVSRSVHPVTVQIQVPADAVLTGAGKTATIDRLEGSGGREKVTWVIRAREGEQVEVRLLSQKGGSESATVTLR